VPQIGLHRQTPGVEGPVSDYWSIFSAMQIQGSFNIRYKRAERAFDLHGTEVLISLCSRTFLFVLIPKIAKINLITLALSARFPYLPPQVSRQYRSLRLAS
jgi:hypothetical protein